MPRRLELWMVRHGESLANTGGKLSGWSDVPLSERGEEQALALKPLLEGRDFDRVWSSDLARALTTARLAFGEPAADERLREMNFGRLEGRRWDEIDETDRDAIMEFVDYRAPGGESIADLRGRVLDWVGDLPDGRHLVFSHGGVIRMLTGTIGHDRFLRNGALVVVDYFARKILFTKNPSEG
jgi:probable phosphoglycerate mutase